MAKRAVAPKVTGTRLDSAWRSSWSGWKVWPMLARIPEDRYEAEALAFQHAARGTLSVDWQGEWRAHCRRRLVERFELGAFA